MGNSESPAKTTQLPVSVERTPTFKPPKPVCLEGIPNWKIYFENNLENLIKRLPPNEEDFEYDAEINSRVSLYKGDITGLKVDGIVGSSNNSLDATAGVSARIADAAGRQFKENLATLNGCRTGDSKVSSGYNLCAKRFLLYFYRYKWLQRGKGRSNRTEDSSQLSEIDRIIFCLHKPTEVTLYENWMQVFFPCRPKTKEEIPSWQAYFKENEEKLINRIIPTGEEDFEFDKDINEKVSLRKGDFTGIQDGISIANEGNFVTSEGVVVRTIGPDVGTYMYSETWYKCCLGEMLWDERKFMVGVKYHPENRAALMVKSVRHWLNNVKNSNRLSKFDRIIFCLYKPEDVVLCEDWMQVYFPCCSKDEMDLLPLPGYVTITVTEPDMLGIDYGRRQAKMPCGHVIGRDSMTGHCRDVMRKGQFQFFCPSSGTPPCNAHWEYFIVRHVARLTTDELTELEKKISENYVMKAKGMQRCPGCQILCYRGEGVGSAVRCPVCTENDGKNFDFCWWCQGKWLSSSSNSPCGNSGCDGKDKRLHILANCPPKSINNCNNCPSIRGCPKCGLLIEHKDKCAHMNCENCPGYGFCFICLKEMKNGKWQCSPWLGNCVLQPRQTALPGSK